MIRNKILKNLRKILRRRNSNSPVKSSANFDWNFLPEPIFDEIMLIIGRESPESLDICKQVCRAWKKGIMRNLWDSPSMKWRSVIERRIEKSCWGPENFPSDEKLCQLKLLGNNAMLEMEIFHFLVFRNQRHHPSRLVQDYGREVEVFSSRRPRY